MEVDEYKKLFVMEDSHWWFKGIRLCFHQALKRTDYRYASRVLDAGCGTGGNLILLSKLFQDISGFDLSGEAVFFCRKKGFNKVTKADINAIPFSDETFDFVISSDVFECREVNEKAAIAELARVTKKGGRILLTVAAFQILLSEHDRAVHSVRRYTKGRAKKAFSIDGLEIIRMEYIFCLFFPFIAAYRSARNLIANKTDTQYHQSDIFMPPEFVNRGFYLLVRIERVLSRWINFPFGSTLMVEMKRI